MTYCLQNSQKIPQIPHGLSGLGMEMNFLTLKALEGDELTVYEEGWTGRQTDNVVPIYPKLCLQGYNYWSRQFILLLI